MKEVKIEIDILNELKIACKEYKTIMESSVVWYTKECFLYKMINNTLRSGNLVNIFKCRLFINALETCLS